MQESNVMSTVSFICGLICLFPSKTKEKFRQLNLNVKLHVDSSDSEEIISWNDFFSELTNILPAFGYVIKQTRYKSRQLPVEDICCFESSRADLSRPITDPSTKAQLWSCNATNVSDLHKQISEVNLFLKNESNTERFEIRAWDNRLVVSNSNASHRIASIRYSAEALGVKCKLTGDLDLYTVDRLALQSVSSMFYIYALPSDNFFRATLSDLLTFADYYAFTVTNKKQSLELWVFLLPKENLQSTMFAKQLKHAKAFNLIEFFKTLAEGQSSIYQRYNLQS